MAFAVPVVVGCKGQRIVWFSIQLGVFALDNLTAWKDKQRVLPMSLRIIYQMDRLWIYVSIKLIVNFTLILFDFIYAGSFASYCVGYLKISSHLKIPTTALPGTR